MRSIEKHIMQISVSINNLEQLYDEISSALINNINKQKCLSCKKNTKYTFDILTPSPHLLVEIIPKVDFNDITNSDILDSINISVTDIPISIKYCNK